MTDRPLPPQFIDEAYAPAARTAPRTDAAKLTFWASLDKTTLFFTGLLLSIGVMMVFSTTFDWSLQDYNNEAAITMMHVRNVLIGIIVMLLFARIEPQWFQRLSLLIMMSAVSFLIAVLLFGEDTFGARRALIDGRFQPGEFAELATIIYLAAWLGSKKTNVRSFTGGLMPFTIIVLIVITLLLLQPDLSVAVTVFITAAAMFFLAGADLRQIGVMVMAVLLAGLTMFPILQEIAPHATYRVESWVVSLGDLTQASYHTQQAAIAFSYGGWTGVGLGESQAKFRALPAPHTDSIFAVIGEELGVLGAGVVIALYVVLCIRGVQISREAITTYSTLLAIGVTVWIIIRAALNIAVMTGLIPPTGLPLPFISYGGSSLVVMMAGIGLLLGVHRQTLRHQNTTERRQTVANYDRSRRNRRARLPRAGNRRGDEQAIS